MNRKRMEQFNVPVAPTAVADFVWREYLRDRGTLTEYWRLPEANYYLQNDRPDVIAHLVRQALGEDLDPVDPSLSVRPEAVRINIPYSSWVSFGRYYRY